MKTKERYHGPLITQGVHLGQLALISWISVFISAFLLAAAIYNDRIGILLAIFWTAVIINGISTLISCFKKIIFRFQSFIYILISINMFILLLDLNFFGLMMFVGGGKVYSRVYSSLSAFFVGLLIIVFIMAVALYIYFYRRDRLTNGAYREKEKKFNSWDSKRSEKFWITFAAVTIIPPLLTGYIENAFGFILGVAVTATFTAVVVDCFYTAAYVRKHPELEEE